MSLFNRNDERDAQLDEITKAFVEQFADATDAEVEEILRLS